MTDTQPQPPQHTNRLIRETSPYLLQHAHNPVDWYPWGAEALKAASEQNKPILLSVGYSACHWCHVMEHESFEDAEIARLMNDSFINIKVDREERPDLDAIYMDFVMMATQSGGWPLTVFLGADLVPFFGGTYFPPQDHYGRPGFKRVLETLASAYRNRRGELEKNREEILERLQQSARWSAPEGDLQAELLEESYNVLCSQFDPQHGGFGGAPKFPSSMVLGFLLRYHRRSGSEDALNRVRISLDKMARGGIYDQLGGGFHRYTVDERWLVPHFEKMLYDNALLSRVYLEAYQLTGNDHYREVVKETLAWVSREMTDPSGGFYSALDADSEGEEGKFYLWTEAEVEAELGGEEAQAFGQFFDVTEVGNFEGKNILNHRVELEKLAHSLSLSPSQLKERLDGARQRLLQARGKRVRPGLDDKVLAAWNGMMLTAVAEAAFVLEDSELLGMAEKNAGFLEAELLVEGRLKRSWKAGEARLNGYLEDYALVCEGWLATCLATGDWHWLELAMTLTEKQVELFGDDEQGDFYFTSTDHEALLVRKKEYLDNATPSGNSTACLNLLRLAVLTGRKDYRERAERMLRQVTQVLAPRSLAFGYWLQALDFWLGPVEEIAVVGSPSGIEALLAPLRRCFLPNKVVVRLDSEASKADLEIPLLEGKKPIDGRATAYLCRDYACREPVSRIEDLERLLADN